MNFLGTSCCMIEHYIRVCGRLAWNILHLLALAARPCDSQIQRSHVPSWFDISLSLVVKYILDVLKFARTSFFQSVRQDIACSFYLCRVQVFFRKIHLTAFESTHCLMLAERQTNQRSLIASFMEITDYLLVCFAVTKGQQSWCVDWVSCCHRPSALYCFFSVGFSLNLSKLGVNGMRARSYKGTEEILNVYINYANYEGKELQRYRADFECLHKLC